MPVARRRDHGLFREAEENLSGARRGESQGARARIAWTFGAGMKTHGAECRDAAGREHAQPRVRSQT